MTAQAKKQTKYAALRALGNLATITGYLVGAGVGMLGVYIILDGMMRGNFLLSLLVGLVTMLFGAFFGVAFVALADVINMGLDALALLRKMAFDKKAGE